MSGYGVAWLEALPSVPTATDPGDPDWKPIQHYFGLTAFGINAYVARAKGDGPAPPLAIPVEAERPRASGAWSWTYQPRNSSSASRQKRPSE